MMSAVVLRLPYSMLLHLLLPTIIPKKIPAGSIPAGEKELLPYSAATSIVTGILFAKR